MAASIKGIFHVHKCVEKMKKSESQGEEKKKSKRSRNSLLFPADPRQALIFFLEARQEGRRTESLCWLQAQAGPHGKLEYIFVLGGQFISMVSIKFHRPSFVAKKRFNIYLVDTFSLHF